MLRVSAGLAPDRSFLWSAELPEASVVLTGSDSVGHRTGQDSGDTSSSLRTSPRHSAGMITSSSPSSIQTRTVTSFYQTGLRCCSSSSLLTSPNLQEIGVEQISRSTRRFRSAISDRSLFILHNYIRYSRHHSVTWWAENWA